MSVKCNNVILQTFMIEIILIEVQAQECIFLMTFYVCITDISGKLMFTFNSEFLNFSFHAENGGGGGGREGVGHFVLCT